MRSKSNISLARAVTAFVLAFALGCSPLTALADVRKSDIIYGTTMSERGIRPIACPSIGAEYAYVIGADGTEYFSHNADTPTQIASITKIMTAIIALEMGSLDRTITVSKNAASVGESSAALWAGDKLTLSDALKGLMIPSGNDAAIAIAENLGDDILKQAKNSKQQLYKQDGTPLDTEDPTKALDAFVARMNAKAKELGCTSTVFLNPHGLDDGKFAGNLYSTAREVSKICAYAMKNNTFRSLCDQKQANLTVQRGNESISVEVLTTDELLGRYEGACGIKTGKTDKAGPCFAGAVKRGNVELYAIILHSTSDSQRFSDCSTLFDWVFNNQKQYKLANSTQTVEMNQDGSVQKVPVVAYVSLTSWLDKTVPATFQNPQETVSVFAPNGNVSQEFELSNVNGGVKAGDVIGKAKFYQRNTEIASVNVIACENVPGPNLIEAIGIWWEKAMRAFSGHSSAAQSVIINETPIILKKAN